ncbi:MAG TPA: sigma-70 family RNA polymerase sigma factor [Longimicrobium sp.]|nr:sigma-70 family RNA polymerase sigma factor [Longimicrobium sp.]
MPPSSPDGHALVRLSAAAQSGCGQALEHLLAEVHVPVARCCRAWLSRIGHGAVQEVAQEALIRIAGGLGACRAENDEDLLTWCRTVARHAAFDRLRSHQREWDVRVFAEELEEVECEIPNPENTTGISVLLQALDEALDAEPEMVHSLLWHRLVQRDGWEEAAGALGLTPAGAKRRFQRTTARLRRTVLSALARRRADDPGAEEALRWLGTRASGHHQSAASS